MTRESMGRGVVFLFGSALAMAVACGGGDGDDDDSAEATGGSSEVTGGASATGGGDAGGATSGGTAGAAAGGTGGEASGGEASGGEASGGEASGGEASGGEASGGEASGGEASGGEASGGEASGGEASGGEATGGIGAGGEGPTDCPTTAPADDSDCVAPDGPPLTCDYGQEICTCAGFGFNSDTWQCTGGSGEGGTTGAGGAGPTDDCPANEPTDGDDCNAPQGQPLTCDYGAASCTCSGFGFNSDTWQCTGGSGEGGTTGAGGAGPANDCPANEPTDGDDCDAPPGAPLTCDYDAALCTCSGFGPDSDTWQCTGGGAGGTGAGGAGATDCPSSEPDVDSACTPPVGPCDYGGTTCFCPANGPNAESWQCN